MKEVARLENLRHKFSCNLLCVNFLVGACLRVFQKNAFWHIKHIRVFFKIVRFRKIAYNLDKLCLISTKFMVKCYLKIILSES